MWYVGYVVDVDVVYVEVVVDMVDYFIVMV